jgi:hypothetical protein
MRALKRPLGLRVARLEDQPANPERAAEPDQRIGRLAAAGMDRALAIPDELLRQRAKDGQTAGHAEGDVLPLPREHQRAGDRARVAQLGGHDPAATRLAVADRDLASRLPEVELQQLPGAVDRALVGAPALIKRAQLAHVVVEDRLAALIAELLDQLADPLGGDPRVLLQQPLDVVLERGELRRSRRALVARRPVPPQRAADRIAVVPGAPDDLVDRQPLDLPHPPDLRPAPHVEHRLLLASHTIWRGSASRRTTPTTRQAGAISTGTEG